MPQLNNTRLSRVIIDPVALQRLLSGKQGPLYQQLINRATIVQMKARQQAHKKTGALAASIIKRPIQSGKGMAMLIGSELPYAAFHHDGTRPHLILPVNAQALVFNWPKAGGIVFLKQVNHPGTKPNRFLTDNLHYFTD